jgi:hypothetical protein
MSPNSAELQHVPTDGLRLRGAEVRVFQNSISCIDGRRWKRMLSSLGRTSPNATLAQRSCNPLHGVEGQTIAGERIKVQNGQPDIYLFIRTLATNEAKRRYLICGTSAALRDLQP